MPDTDKLETDLGKLVLAFENAHKKIMSSKTIVDFSKQAAGWGVAKNKVQSFLNGDGKVIAKGDPAKSWGKVVAKATTDYNDLEKKLKKG